jgi:hypothetical protein
MKTLISLLGIVILLGIYGLIDHIERNTEASLAYASWVRDACIPARKGERAIAVHEGSRMSCTIYSEYYRGMQPVVLSAAVMETP